MEYHVRDFGALVKDAEVFAKISRNNATSTNLPLTKTNQARADSIQHRDRLGPIQGLFYNHGGPTYTDTKGAERCSVAISTVAREMRIGSPSGTGDGVPSSTGAGVGLAESGHRGRNNVERGCGSVTK